MIALFWDCVEFKTRFKHGLKFYNCTCANTKNMFCSNNFNFSQHLFLFLHDLLTRIYTNVYHMFTYEQSWSYQTKKKCTFWFHWNYYPCEHWIFNNIILKMMLFLACFEFYREISSTTSSLLLISIESLRSCIAH